MIYDITKRGTHTVKITLQFQDFIGHIITQIGGNCHGKTVLDFDFECEDEFDTDFVKNDCNLKYDEEYDSFHLTLKNNKGEALAMNATSDELNNMIVGAEIIGFVPESEADNE